MRQNRVHLMPPMSNFYARICVKATPSSNMLPLSVQTEETFRGHMVLTFIATIVAKLLSDRLKETKYPIQPTLANLATQSCSEIKGSLITSEPNKVTRLAYKAAGVEYPVCIE